MADEKNRMCIATGRIQPKKVEYCVLCGAKTTVPVCLPISKRSTYVPTVGHICEDCCRKCFGTNDIRVLPWLWDEFL